MFEVLDIYDYFIVGVGFVGCLLVNWFFVDFVNCVLLLEVGGLDNYFWIYIFVGYFYCIGNLCIDWCFDIDEVFGFNGCFLKYLCGKVFGGCFLINGMIYMCGQVCDYDQWVVEGNLGWSWRELLLLFCRMEDYFVGISEMYGVGGEWWVECQWFFWKLFDVFQQVVVQIGIVSVEDFNGGDNEGCGYFQVNQCGGVCWNVLKGFLCGIVQCVNLMVLIYVEVQ